MKTKSKIIAGSLLSIALAGGIAAGTTYALFTSDASNEIEITAGRVKVASTIEQIAAYTPKVINMDGTIADDTDIADNTAEVKKFGLNGTVSIDGDKVVIERMMPGDKVTVKYKVANESNVTIKQRDNIEVVADGGLAAGLVCTYDGDPMVFGKTVWETKDVADVIEHIVVIELPAANGNEFQEKSCSIRFSTEGVQANAAVKNVFAVKHADGSETGYAGLQEAFTNVGNGETVVLNESATITNPVTVDFDNTYSNVTFDGNGNLLNVSVPNGKDGLIVYDNLIVKNLNVNGNGRVGLNFLGGTVHTLNKVNVLGKYSSYAVAFTNTCGGTLTDCTVKNSFEGAGVYTDYGVPYVIDLFANRAHADKVTFVNSDADLVFVNCSKYWEGPNAKVVVDGESQIKTVITASPASSTVVEGAGYAGIEHVYHQVNEQGLYEDKKEVNVYSVVDASGLVELSAQVAGGNEYEGKTIKLLRNIDMSSVANFEPIGNHYSPTFGGTFDGGNFSIKNLKVSKTGTDANAGLFGSLHAGGQVENVIIDGADIQSEHYAGGIIGWLESGSITPNIKNCQVINSKIVSKTHFVDPEWDDGDKAGGIAGYVWGSNISNCLVKNCTIQGYRDIGGIVGILNSSGASVTDCRVEDCVLINDRSHNYKGYTTDAEYHVNEIIGEHAAGTESGNTFSGVTKQIIGA